MTRDEAVGLIRASGLGTHADALLATLRPSLALRATRLGAAQLPLGASRVGGLPDLPPATPWPTRDGRPFDFLAQIDLGEVASTGASLGLPKTGSLAFFQGWTRAWTPVAHVRHLDVPLTVLARTAPPAPPVRSWMTRLLLRLWSGSPHPRPTLPCRVEWVPGFGLPEPDDCLSGVHSLSDEECDAFFALRDKLTGLAEREPQHRLGGHPATIQGEVRIEGEVNSRLAATPDAVDGPLWRDPEVQLAARDLHLLLQLDSDRRGPGWMFGDAGMVYFLIRPADLAARAFERVRVAWQCG